MWLFLTALSFFFPSFSFVVSYASQTIALYCVVLYFLFFFVCVLDLPLLDKYQHQKTVNMRMWYLIIKIYIFLNLRGTSNN